MPLRKIRVPAVDLEGLRLHRTVPAARTVRLQMDRWETNPRRIQVAGEQVRLRAEDRNLVRRVGGGTIKQ